MTAPGQDELGELGASFNAMAAALEQTEQRRMQLIGDVAHELRTPIATLSGYLEGLMDGVVQPSDQTWARLHGETGRSAPPGGRSAGAVASRGTPTAAASAALVADGRCSDCRRPAPRRFVEKGVSLEVMLPMDCRGSWPIRTVSCRC